MTRYRLKAYDPVNDIWTLQKHVFWFLWSTISVGPKAKLQAFIDENSESSSAAT